MGIALSVFSHSYCWHVAQEIATGDSERDAQVISCSRLQSDKHLQLGATRNAYKKVFSPLKICLFLHIVPHPFRLRPRWHNHTFPSTHHHHFHILSTNRRRICYIASAIRFTPAIPECAILEDEMSSWFNSHDAKEFIWLRIAGRAGIKPMVRPLLAHVFLW